MMYSYQVEEVIQADEEQLLLEAIDMAGFGNWTAVADHVGTKSKEECQVMLVVLYARGCCGMLCSWPLVAFTAVLCVKSVCCFCTC